MVKNYILDTNVIIHDPNCFFNFEDNNVIIPIVAIEELDNIKNREGMVGYHARIAARELNSLRSQGNLEQGIKTPDGGTIRIELNHMDMSCIPQGIDTQKNDTRILAMAKNLQKETPHIPTILVTKDVYMAIKADSFGIEAQDYNNDKIKCDELYTGYRDVYAPSEKINLIYKGGLPAHEISLEEPLYPNEFLNITSLDDDNHKVLARFDGSLIVPLKYAKQTAWGLSPINREQKMAFELLMDKDIPFVTITGGAGSGKTRVLTRRIAYLVSQRDVHPGSILAITFTNKAAAEMRSRVIDLVGNRARLMWVSTFHSACVRILRSEIDAMGFRKTFSIYDDTDAKRLMTLVARDQNLDPKKFPPRALLNWVSNCKNELITPDHRTALQADLEKRTGLKINRIVIDKVDFLRDIANVTIYYNDSTQGAWIPSTEPSLVLSGKLDDDD